MMQEKMSHRYKLGENIINNNGGCERTNSPSSFHIKTPLIDITSSWSNERNKNIHTHPIESVLPSKKQLNVSVIQFMDVNLFNHFANENHNNASSSTSNVPIQGSATFTTTPNGNIENINSGDENLTNDSLSVNSCEFQNKDANYDTSSSFDDEEEYDPNSTLLDSDNIGYSDTGDPVIECTQFGTLKCNNSNIIPKTVTRLKLMLDEFNTHAKSFRMAADRLKDCHAPDMMLKLISYKSRDGRIYNQSTVSEVAALIIGDVDVGAKVE
ncbi:hypothetical protein KIW84_045944 [Lathyrus oleraceus]|uniref:Uncharacterized protein n=1 Tax=Pisum sativum TaxID=3888 RepID=A0A9D4XPG4_PEA|nr:hypothetical protein KIW84_045944 [Pisum sativum]